MINSAPDCEIVLTCPGTRGIGTKFAINGDLCRRLLFMVAGIHKLSRGVNNGRPREKNKCIIYGLNYNFRVLLLVNSKPPVFLRHILHSQVVFYIRI